jgi:hypothetical protein
MNLTRRNLRRLIKEELQVLLEVKDPDFNNIRIGGARDRVGDYTLQVYGPGATPEEDGGSGPTGEWESNSGQHIDKAREHILYLLDKHPKASVEHLMSSDYGYEESFWGGEDKPPGRRHQAPKEVSELMSEF